MGINKKPKKFCVLVGCENEAIDICNNCNIPVCEEHGKKTGQAYLCVNCIDYLKRLKV
jgi:hypothetical protein